jgi:hypothetical protein
MERFIFYFKHFNIILSYLKIEIAQNFSLLALSHPCVEITCAQLRRAYLKEGGEREREREREKLPPIMRRQRLAWNS